MSKNTGIADRVAGRFAAMSDEKMKALLLKLRKGADSSVSLKQLIEALKYLGGWRIEPFVGLVQKHGYMGEEKDEPSFEAGDNADHIRHLWEEAKRDEVRALPSNPRHGQRYTMDVTDMKVWPADRYFKADRTAFYFREWEGANGIQFTSPEGKIFEHLPGKSDLGRHQDPMKLSFYDLKRWLRQDTNFLTQVSNNLGLATYEDERREKTTPRTRDNTGTCACCFRNIKLKARGGNQHPLMVLHGYERPGWGSVHGQCVGVDFPPFELSCEGTKHLVKSLKKSKDNKEDFLRRLKAGEITKLDERGGYAGTKFVTVTLAEEGPARWKQRIDGKISQMEGLIRSLGRDIDLLEGMISSWKEQPLPTEGEKVKPPPALLR